MHEKMAYNRINNLNSTISVMPQSKNLRCIFCTFSVVCTVLDICFRLSLAIIFGTLIFELHFTFWCTCYLLPHYVWPQLLCSIISTPKILMRMVLWSPWSNWGKPHRAFWFYKRSSVTKTNVYLPKNTFDGKIVFHIFSVHELFSQRF